MIYLTVFLLLWFLAGAVYARYGKHPDNLWFIGFPLCCLVFLAACFYVGLIMLDVVEAPKGL